MTIDPRIPTMPGERSERGREGGRRERESSVMGWVEGDISHSLKGAFCDWLDNCCTAVSVDALPDYQVP